MDRPIALFELANLSPEARERLLVRSEADLVVFEERVKPIIEEVRRDGDAALARFGARFDGATGLKPDAIRTPQSEFDEAMKSVAPEVVEALEYAVDNVRRYHEAQLPEEMWMKEVRPGIFAGERWSPIDSVACYVPRGKGSFPSVAVMTAVPAMVAKVPRVIICTPPLPDGRTDPATLVAAKLAGVTEVYRCGGAQAVAAVAYGTATVPRVLKMVGPGSPYLVAAKKLLSHRIDPGILAGPSESIILADQTADGRLAALDLLIEAEHGPDSSCFLVTNSRVVAEAARAAIPGFWAQMSDQRVDFSATVLKGPQGGIVLTPDFDAACGFVNDYAPEHLTIHAKDPWRYLGKIRNAAEILLGERTPNTLANFVLGPNAVLPTSGAARTSSALSVYDFVKRSSLAYVTTLGYPDAARHAGRLATYEGFDGHANAVSATRDRLMAEDK
ncbi:MAG: histidinol dehydrogenase [Rhodospirillum sp.]|nr:histidinol dehydrogenase [Rhodospirillum sp.]